MGSEMCIRDSSFARLAAGGLGLLGLLGVAFNVAADWQKYLMAFGLSRHRAWVVRQTPLDLVGISWCASRGPLETSFQASWRPFWVFWGSLRASRGPLGASWVPLGGLLGPLGALLGPPWALSGRKARFFRFVVPLLGPSWGPLGLSWAPLGPSWGPLLLGRLGASESRKGEKAKNFQNH